MDWASDPIFDLLKTPTGMRGLGPLSSRDKIQHLYNSTHGHFDFMIRRLCLPDVTGQIIVHALEVSTWQRPAKAGPSPDLFCVDLM